MTYLIARVNDQWRITADGTPLPTVYPTGTAAREALQKLRNGHTATTVATISRKQAVRREYRESVGK